MMAADFCYQVGRTSPTVPQWTGPWLELQCSWALQSAAFASVWSARAGENMLPVSGTAAGCGAASDYWKGVLSAHGWGLIWRRAEHVLWPLKALCCSCCGAVSSLWRGYWNSGLNSEASADISSCVLGWRSWSGFMLLFLHILDLSGQAASVSGLALHHLHTSTAPGQHGPPLVHLLGALIDRGVDIIVVLKVSGSARQDVDVHVRNALPCLRSVLHHSPVKDWRLAGRTVQWPYQRFWASI